MASLIFLFWTKYISKDGRWLWMPVTPATWSKLFHVLELYFFPYVSWNIHLTTKCSALVPLTGIGPGNTWHCAGSSAVWLLNRHYIFITLAAFHVHSFSLSVSGFGLIFALGLTALASPLSAVSCTPEMLMHIKTAPENRENSFWAVWVSVSHCKLMAEVASAPLMTDTFLVGFFPLIQALRFSWWRTSTNH